MVVGVFYDNVDYEGAGTGGPAIPGSSNSRVYGIVGAGLWFAFVAFLLIRRARAARTDP